MIYYVCNGTKECFGLNNPYIPRKCMNRMLCYPTTLIEHLLPQKKMGGVISRRTDFAWPAMSPDLNPCDFFLWGHLKTKVYSEPYPETMEELREKIKNEIKVLNRDKDLFKRVFDNFLVRLQYVLSMKGGHIENFM